MDVPYPQRRLLELEILADVDTARADGVVVDARLSRDDLDQLGWVHATRVHKLLARFGERRRGIETGLAFLPLVAALVFISQEEIMVDFIREGGVGMFVLLAVGGFLLGRELLHVVRLIVVKDHSEQNLRLDTTSVVVGCLALMLLSLASTTLGLYKSASGVAEAHLGMDVFFIGAKESVTNLVLASFLCALILLAHYGTRRTMAAWQAPIAS